MKKINFLNIDLNFFQSDDVAVTHLTIVCKINLLGIFLFDGF